MPKATNKLWSASEAAQTYTEITDGSTTLNVGEGYVARVGFEGAYSLTGTAFNTGNVNITGLTRSGNDVDGEYGYNLIGNPYPSSVNWSSATRTNVETTLWYRTHTAGNVMISRDLQRHLGGIGTNNGNYIGAPMLQWASSLPDRPSGCVWWMGSLQALSPSPTCHAQPRLAGQHLQAGSRRRHCAPYI
jgi:hypothetical protein